MANTAVIILFSIVLLCITATQGRKTLHQNNEWLTSYPVVDDIDGICKTMVETQGYTCEEHKVTTEDGYILSLQRMPVGRSGKKADKPPVLLQHGIFADAITWLFNLPDESLGFILADNGYDVWLANTRGTKYSSGHTSLDPNDMAYWDWSWDELASYDLPAFVQYVYNQTGQKVHYVGYSLGALMALAAFSQGQVLNMLRSAALLGPTAHMNQITSLPIKIAAESFIADAVYWLGLREFIPNGQVEAKFVEDICNTLHMNCLKLITPFTGPNCCINSSRIDVFLDHEPQPTATKNLIHLSQMIRTGNIAKYDYDVQEQNMQNYGQPVPPPYDMTEIPNEFPLFLSNGGQDMLSDVKDLQVLLNDLKDHDGNKLVVLFKEDYAHLDYAMGVNANQMIYDPMMAFFKDN
ncbi:triacylglycerol lipase 2 [Cajanus cajan]|uniref:Lipase n=1 Tax=Cajanus cajan TaxID=3821 RepID=A0A151R994_CAJCA|nr:triacylglycerol lipase 2 [Cajanus cajan]KYP39107.1 Triacylglycerol lipase 2 [Cajanus cajan]